MHEIMQESSSTAFLIDEAEETPNLAEALHFQESLPPSFVITPARSFPIIPYQVRRGARSTPQTRAFRKRFYPRVKDSQWNDWHWRIQNRIHTLAQAEIMLHLSESEREAYRVRPISGPRWRRVWRSFAGCGALRAAMPCPPT